MSEQGQINIEEESESSQSGNLETVNVSISSESDTTFENEELSEQEVQEEESTDLNLNIAPYKSPFKFKNTTNGNIMTIHHTLTEDNKLIRVRIGVCCFSYRGLSILFVAIDKRGNIFVFDLTAKRHWKLGFVVLKASIIVPLKHRQKDYLIGTKTGQLLLINVESSLVLKAVQISQTAITEISFAESKLHTKHLALIHTGIEAIIFDLNAFLATHRLEFDEARMSLKYACYMPHSDQIFTCFTNDSVHIWSGSSLKILYKTHPIKARNLKLRSINDRCSPPEIRLGEFNDDACFELGPCLTENFSEGFICAYNFTTQDGGLLCLATVDKYLTLLSPHTFDVQQIYRLRDFTIEKCAFVAQPRQGQYLILALTKSGKVALLDCQCPEFKIIIHECAVDIIVAADGKLIAVLAKTGEAEVWTVDCLYNALMSQRQCMLMLKEAFKQPKPIALAPSNECFNDDIKKLLKRDRLICILREHGCYPAKYRGLIWCSLLKLPCNRQEFQKLLKMSTPPVMAKRIGQLTLKNGVFKRALIKIWSCLANWCKAFAYSDFFPHLIFPFVKMFPKNSLVTFEICVTLLMNHFQHWFEFHPAAPKDYLGMCENVLQYYDSELCAFYVKLGITGQEYAWPILSTCFAEVLDEEQWLMLWDNIISCPIYFPIFCVVSYNILLREVILLLPDKKAVEQLFQERNPVMARKLLKKSFKLMHDCPPERHPSRYFTDFQAIPKRVYPKFLRYPRELVKKHEDDMLALQRENDAIEERIRQLELNEKQLMAELEKGLKEEEHAKRLKEMERLYYESIKREEERVSCQRKLLLLYQKEIRGYKGQVLSTLRESDRRKRALELEQQMDMLMHSIARERQKYDSALVLAEDEIQNQNFELLARQQFLEQQNPTADLAKKFQNDIQRLVRERSMLHQQVVELTMPNGNAPWQSVQYSNLEKIEKHLVDIQREFFELTEFS